MLKERGTTWDSRCRVKVHSNHFRFGFLGGVLSKWLNAAAISALGSKDKVAESWTSTSVCLKVMGFRTFYPQARSLGILGNSGNFRSPNICHLLWIKSGSANRQWRCVWAEETSSVSPGHQLCAPTVTAPSRSHLASVFPSLPDHPFFIKPNKDTYPSLSLELHSQSTLNKGGVE